MNAVLERENERSAPCAHVASLKVVRENPWQRTKVMAVFGGQKSHMGTVDRTIRTLVFEIGPLTVDSTQVWHARTSRVARNETCEQGSDTNWAGNFRSSI
jgi:hypothetical protein